MNENIKKYSIEKRKELENIRKRAEIQHSKDLLKIEKDWEEIFIKDKESYKNGDFISKIINLSLYCGISRKLSEEEYNKKTNQYQKEYQEKMNQAILKK